MNNLLNVEEITLDDSELLDIIPCANRKYSFPVITVTEHNLYYNSRCELLMNYDRIKFQLASNYLIIMPAALTDKKSFSLWKPYNGCGGLISTMPTDLLCRKAIKPGVYRVYKYKNGIAIKRYDPLEVAANG